MLLRVGRTGRRKYGALNMGALLDSISEVPTAARQASDPTLLALPRLDRDAQSASHYTSCATILASSVSTPAVEAKNAAIAATEPTNMPAVSPSRTARARTHAARASPATASPMPMPITIAHLRSPSAPPTIARNRAPMARAGVHGHGVTWPQVSMGFVRYAIQLTRHCTLCSTPSSSS